MKYIKSSGGYYYKELSNGKRTRVPAEEYNTKKQKFLSKQGGADNSNAEAKTYLRTAKDISDIIKKCTDKKSKEYKECDEKELEYYSVKYKKQQGQQGQQEQQDQQDQQDQQGSQESASAQTSLSQEQQQKFYKNFIAGVAEKINESNVTYLNYKDNNMETQNKNFKRLIVGIGLDLMEEGPYIITDNIDKLENKKKFYDDSYQILFILKKMLTIQQLKDIYKSYFKLYEEVNDEKKFKYHNKRILEYIGTHKPDKTPNEKSSNLYYYVYNPMNTAKRHFSAMLDMTDTKTENIDAPVSKEPSLTLISNDTRNGFDEKNSERYALIPFNDIISKTDDKRKEFFEGRINKVKELIKNEYYVDKNNVLEGIDESIFSLNNTPIDFSAFCTFFIKDTDKVYVILQAELDAFGKLLFQFKTGGSVELGDTPIEANIDEFLEETGLSLNLGKKADADPEPDPDPDPDPDPEKKKLKEIFNDEHYKKSEINTMLTNYKNRKKDLFYNNNEKSIEMLNGGRVVFMKNKKCVVDKTEFDFNKISEKCHFENNCVFVVEINAAKEFMDNLKDKKKMEEVSLSSEKGKIIYMAYNSREVDEPIIYSKYLSDAKNIEFKLTPEDDEKFKLKFTYGNNTDNNNTVNKLKTDYEFDNKEREISYRKDDYVEKFVEIQRGKNISNVVDILQEDAFKKYNINKIDDFNTETKFVEVSKSDISESENIIIETDMEGDDFMALFIILPKLLELEKLKKITFIIGESNPGKINQKRIIFQDFLKRTFEQFKHLGIEIISESQEGNQEIKKIINNNNKPIEIEILNGIGGNFNTEENSYTEYPIQISGQAVEAVEDLDEIKKAYRETIENPNNLIILLKPPKDFYSFINSSSQKNDNPIKNEILLYGSFNLTQMKDYLSNEK